MYDCNVVGCHNKTSDSEEEIERLGAQYDKMLEWNPQLEEIFILPLLKDSREDPMLCPECWKEIVARFPAEIQEFVNG